MGLALECGPDCVRAGAAVITDWKNHHRFIRQDPSRQPSKLDFQVKADGTKGPLRNSAAAKHKIGFSRRRSAYL